MPKGEVSQLWKLECQTLACTNVSVSSTRYQTDAIDVWRRHGWRIRRKKWMCPDCIRKENNHYGVTTRAPGPLQPE